MWGEIDNKPITNMKESFCLGEACLIFEYGKEAQRTVAFRSATDLKKAERFFKEGNKNYIIDVLDKEVHIVTSDVKVVLNVVNHTHATRLADILDNFKK